MNYCIICTEYPPAHIPPGGIGTYVYNIAHLLAEAGDTVHVIGRLWPGAPERVEEFCNSRLIVHRVPLDEPLQGTSDAAEPDTARKKIEALRKSEYSEQCFAWQASLYLERLIEEVQFDVIEAQEINAPIYFFLLRRALGLGPDRKPPCVIHLHSSSELIVRHNEWDPAHPFWVTAKRLEDYCISAADALLCPSQFLARQTEREFGFPADTVTTIPLPIGDTPLLDRSPDIWGSGSVCYFGRLEPRKGIIEWVDAAVSVADDYPEVTFEFIGADLEYTAGYSVQQYVVGRIPRRLRDRFQFRGSHSKGELLEFLGKARTAVVPSRWENFPNTCVEAMCTGLPVIATPNGGMAEMIDDDETGWISSDTSAEALAKVLRRALDTPPERRAAMGECAAISIRKICDNNATVARHRAFRAEVAERGPAHSFRLPGNLPFSGHRELAIAEQQDVAGRTGHGIVVIFNVDEDFESAHKCVTSVEQQSVTPCSVVVIPSAADASGYPAFEERMKLCGWHVVENADRPVSAMLNGEIARLMASGEPPLAFVILDGKDQLESNFIGECTRVLRHAEDVGVVSMWVSEPGQENELVARPCPAFPYQLLGNEVASCAVIRTAALPVEGIFRSDMEHGFERWQLINSILAQGWKGVTIPEILVSRPRLRSEYFPGADRMYHALLASTPDLVSRYALHFVRLTRPDIPDPMSMWSVPMRQSSRTDALDQMGIAIVKPRDLLAAPMSQKVRIARKFIKNPKPAFRFLAWYATSLFRKKRG